ncbi:hypothetical protein [Sphaerotilus sp.]|uniref:hypothetical protein n=1 Tax=Sphaerotilus sp. TaxID=2093942 RepID=UPI0034E30342
MNANQFPDRITVAFAQNGDRRAIPAHASDAIAANQPSLETGFGVTTSIPKAAGGMPPSRIDFNSILNLLSAANRWAQAGGLYPFNAAFATAIGGHPKGAVLLSTDGVTVWQSETDNNVTDPDGTSAAGWRLLAPRPDVTRADLGSHVAGKGASLVGVQDTAGNWTSADLEQVTAEAGTRLHDIETAFGSGTFTPVMTGHLPTGPGSIALAGRWARVGKVLTWTVTVTSVGGGIWSSAAGSTKVTGLPYAPALATSFSLSFANGETSGTGTVTTAGDIKPCTLVPTAASMVFSGSFVIA